MGTTEATLRMENVDVKEEWQDEDFPRFVPAKPLLKARENSICSPKSSNKKRKVGQWSWGCSRLRSRQCCSPCSVWELVSPSTF